MSIQASKPNNKVFLLLGIVLAALAFGGVLFALRQNSGSTESVVVAKKAITAGTTVTADLVTTVDLPQSSAPSDAYTVVSAVAGKTTTVTIAANDPLVPAFFEAQPLAAQSSPGANGAPAPVSVETSITKGDVALTIPAAGTSNQLCTPPPPINTNWTSGDQVSAGYYILQGDHIDILVSPSCNTSVRYSFQDVPVLRVGTSGASGAPSVYLVEVPRSQSELLTSLLSGQSKMMVLRYVLRPQSEWGKVAADNSSYTPNYEAAGSPSPPKPSDPGVDANTLNSLFGG